MRLLLDTHIVLWQFSGERALPASTRATIERADDLLFSVVSFAEIGVKAAIGKLEVPDDLAEHIRASGLRVLGLSPAHGLGVAKLPAHHRDPFDRLLIAQAITDGLAVVTADARFSDYPITVISAS